MIFKKVISFIRRSILGYCDLHGYFKYPKRYRMNTAYVDDKMNYSFGCKYCQEESYAYWQERWDEYCSGCR